MAPRKRSSKVSEDVPVLVQAGDTGLKVQGGYLWEEYLPALRGKKGVEQFQEMMDSALPGAFMLLIGLVAEQITWTCKPAKGLEEDPRAKYEAEFLRGCLDDLRIPWTQIVGEHMSSIAFGWARSEILYKLRRGRDQESDLLRSDFNDGRFGWLDFEPRSQDSLERWEFGGTGKLLGMHQSIPTGHYYIPEAKMLTSIPRPFKRSPEGRSMFRPGWRQWFFARKFEDIEAIGIERDMTGLVYAQLPARLMSPSATEAEKSVRRDYENKIRKLRRGQMEGFIGPAEEEGDRKSGFKLQLLASGGNGRISPDGAIRRHESRLLVSLLSEFLLLGMDKAGSWALADSKMNTVELAMAGLLNAIIVQPMKQRAIPDLMRLNGVPDEYWPTLEYGDIHAPDRVELSNILGQLIGSGAIIPDSQLEEWVRTEFDLPMRDAPSLEPERAERIMGDVGRGFVATSPDAPPTPSPQP